MADAAGPAPGQLSQAPDQAGLMPTDATGRLKPRAGERQARPSDIVVRSEAASPPRMAPGLAGASSPQRSSSPFHGSAASPSHLLRSASPRHLSPATSQIFERDVQEAVVAPELSPGIPSHIQTEDHIPPVLEASSLALTDRHLDPDEVEIVTHSAHQPAGLNVAGGAPPALSDSFASASGMSSLNELAAAAAPGALDHADEAASPAYGTVDLNDNRRLSFISFADVVHAEHAESMRDGMHPLSASSTSLTGARSPSPIRSPLSSGGGGSPPASGAASFRGVEVSPVRGTGASIASSHGPGHGHGSGHGELTIETMRQALQKPNSNELPGGGGGTASAPISPVGADMPGRFPQ